MILTQQQAGAVYSALCALKAIRASLVAVIPTELPPIRVRETTSGLVLVERLLSVDGAAPDGPWLETHHNQKAFATAYGLQQDGVTVQDHAS